MNNTAARAANLIGVAVIGLLFAVTFRLALPDAAPSGGQAAEEALAQARERPTAALTQPASDIPTDLQAALEEASITGYRTAMLGGAGLTLLAAIAAFVGVKRGRL